VVVPDRSYSEALEFDSKTIKEFQAGRLAASNPLNEERIVALLQARGLREKTARKRMSDGVTVGPLN